MTETLYIIEMFNCRLAGIINTFAPYTSIVLNSVGIIKSKVVDSSHYEIKEEPNVPIDDVIFINSILDNGFINFKIDVEDKSAQILLQMENKAINKSQFDKLIQYFVDNLEVTKVKITTIPLKTITSVKTKIIVKLDDCKVTEAPKEENIEETEESEEE